MPRDLPLSNGKLLVLFDREYRITDLYFPHVGKENHAAGHVFRFGVWADGAFRWVDGSWKLKMQYGDTPMVTDVTARNDDLGIELQCSDAVDFFENVIVRHIRVHNLADRPREVRLFFHHDFHIHGNSIGDTAMYSPEVEAFIHYKDNRYFLISFRVGESDGVPFYACGNKDIGGAEGTWRDAEDGVLGGNPIAQGSVDSTVGVSVFCPARGAADAYYWMAAAHDFQAAVRIDKTVRKKSPAELIRRTRNYWKLWVENTSTNRGNLPALVADRYRQSLLIVRSHIDHEGAVIAAGDTEMARAAADTYSYVWPRDGALVAASLLSAGHVAAPVKFFEFCSRVISPNGYMRHKYNADGTLASSWHPYVRDGKPVLAIQEDGTALGVWAVGEYFDRFHQIEELAPWYRTLVTRPADFMLAYTDPITGLPLPSHDLWEERWGVHLYTVVSVIAGLRAAARITAAFGEDDLAAQYRACADRMFEAMMTLMWSERDQRFARMVVPGVNGYTRDMTMDSAIFALTEFGVLPADSPQMVSTAQQLEQRLWVQTDIGGMARYENDYYHQVERGDTARIAGNPWFICTLWLARYRILRARSSAELAGGRDLIEWAAKRAFPSGVMAEQLHPYTGEPLSVSPLTWSHAEYVSVVRAYCERAAHLERAESFAEPGPAFTVSSSASATV
jgi:glucoamylase